MKLFWLTLGFGALSSIVPVFNMEAYIVLVFAKSSMTAWEIAAVGSLGQNIGKLAWYYAARGVLDVPWLQHRLDQPKQRERYDKWRAQIEGRPWFSFALTFVSAAIGFPPFFAMAAVAGSLRMNVVVFFTAGLIGRFIFFWILLAGAGLIVH